MRIGVLSDTHGALHPAIATSFTGVDEIFHLGDVGTQRILDELEAIAPVTAVSGNMDPPGLVAHLPESKVVTRANRRIVLLHGHRVRAAEPVELLRATRPDRPDLVLFGHTHEPLLEELEGVTFFNPGAAGKPRFRSRPTIGLLEITLTGMRLEHRALEGPFGSSVEERRR
ncbi:MAG: metallophosphoesterase family protein [Gemmatimonadetes bacterium]|nr:metallophosphoesterase family protein [Gemmatimonadota bacterium]